jgi:CRP-like cAMP-binding protein
VAKAKKTKNFSVEVYLSTLDGEKTVSTYRKKQKVFSQGDAADAVYYVQEGQLKVCVISERGKEAVVTRSMGREISSAKAV